MRHQKQSLKRPLVLFSACYWPISPVLCWWLTGPIQNRFCTCKDGGGIFATICVISPPPTDSWVLEVAMQFWEVSPPHHHHHHCLPKVSRRLLLIGPLVPVKVDYFCLKNQSKVIPSTSGRNVGFLRICVSILYCYADIVTVFLLWKNPCRCVFPSNFSFNYLHLHTVFCISVQIRCFVL